MRFRKSYFVFVLLIFVVDDFAELPTISFGLSGNPIGCSLHSFEFCISKISGNTSNTEYQLNFGDGSPVLNFTQANVPSTVIHIYSSVSCGQTYGRLASNYGATSTAIEK
jgi:hypothetical protein